MAANKQPIEGGSLINSIVSLFFKGVDSILDSAAEYEEEMGVLKQVTHIPLQDEDGKQYELTIKLAPVRDKEGVFYVEAFTDKPGFDVSSMNGVALRLNNRTMKEFNSKINEMIEKNKLTVVKEDEAKDDESENDSTSFSEAEVTEMIEKLQKKFKPMEVNLPGGSQFGPEPGILDTEIVLSDDKQSCIVTINVGSVGGSNLSIQPRSETYPIAREEVLVAKISSLIDDYMSKNKIEKKQKDTNSSKIVDATLKKVTGSTELTLMAINASCNIKAALDMLTDVADDEEFINSFTDDEERSIEITDLGDNYDVEEIDEVDITPTYNVLFRQASYLCSKLAAARWALGEIEWNKLLPICSIEWALSNLLNSAASWVVRHEGRYPTPQNPYSDCDYADFSCCEDESGKLQPECLQSMLLEDLDELVLLLDNYYVNLEYDEQSVVATALTEFKRTLTYA